MNTTSRYWFTLWQHSLEALAAIMAGVAIGGVLFGAAYLLVQWVR